MACLLASILSAGDEVAFAFKGRIASHLSRNAASLEGPRRYPSRTGLQPTQQGQDDDDDEDEADDARGSVPPPSTMSPCWKDAEQDKNEDNDKDCA
jgi:hypothetical protein